MRTFEHLVVSTAVSLSIIFAALPQGVDPSARQKPAAREDAYRANNLGVAMLEQYKYKEAAGQFRRALQIDPQLAIARINLAIALYNDPDLEGSLREAKAAASSLPAAPQPHYILGLIAKSQNRADDAIASFKRVLQIDPRDVGANINLGQIYAQQRKYTEAIAAFRVALDAEPYNKTAVYSLGLALVRAGQREEGQQMIQRFQALDKAGYGTVIGQSYPEQGQYAEAISSTGAEPDLVETATPDVTFADATVGAIAAKAQESSSAAAFRRSFKADEFNEAAKRDLIASLGGGATLFDYDTDGDLDLFEVAPSTQRLYRNDAGKFVDVTEGSGLSSVGSSVIGIVAAAGDYDNDEKTDLFVLRSGGNSLYRNLSNGKFSDVTATAGIPNYAYLSLATAFVDVDHDGDLDIFIAGFADLAKAPGREFTFPDDFAGAPNMLLRNDGNGKFTDITTNAKVAGSLGHAVAIVPTDYDNRRDVDLLLVNYGDAPTLLGNLRDGTFRNVAAEVGLAQKARFTCVAAGDVNKDSYTDFFFGKIDEPGLFAMSDGRGRFALTPAPTGSELVSAAHFLDYDNDGLLDLVFASNAGVRILRNVGNKWENVSEKAVARDLTSDSSLRSLGSGDMDNDGDTDLILRSTSGRLRLARNDGGNRNRSLRIQLAAKVSNRSGVGAKIETRAGSLKQKLETYAASPAPAPSDVVFGLGKRASADAVRILWPAGIVQAETEISADPKNAAASMRVTELDRKPSSCPYLYTWNGERFEFITDFMGGGEMGYWEAPGVYNHPDPDEYVRIREDQLKARDGRYEIRITNELEEVLYVDRLQLIAVAHPAGTEVYPNEGMTVPPRPFKLYATRNARPPIAAVDEHDHDVLARIAKLDRVFPDDFSLRRIRGYAEEHTLTLDLGNTNGKRTLLLLTGWTDYAFSSDNVAAHQAGLSMQPPALQVKDADGRWKTVISQVGIPVGRPQTIVIDLSGKFLSSSREVRIVTNMRIYWDQILVATSISAFPMQMTRLDASSAELRWRGYSAEVSPDGREPFGYDYSRVSFTSPWKVMPGRYTREGDVRQLLLSSDDMFVVARTGDEIALSFDASRLPALPRGWKRTFLLYADGFSKEMDINSASPDQVAPLPFHGMKSYPYKASEAYPILARRRAYVERYNTRVVASPLPQIESLSAEEVFSTSRR